MAHTRIRPFNTKETYSEQNLDNDLWLKGVFPVSTGLVVSALARPEWLVEIDATAVLNSPASAN